MVFRDRVVSATLLLFVASSNCGPELTPSSERPSPRGCAETSAETSEDVDETPEACDPPPSPAPTHATASLLDLRVRKLDLLFVIDNSASMAEEAPAIASSFESLGEVLRSGDVGPYDLRFAITTTDSAHPACTGPTRDGRFELSSCRDRPAAFLAPSSHGRLDVFDAGCLAACPMSGLSTLPSYVAGQPLARPRPWIERRGCETNLAGGLSFDVAMACAGPQGISGCATESPLDAMDRALSRAFDPNDPAFGFVRDDAALLVVFMTDEEDCSAAKDTHAQFGPESDTEVSVHAGQCWDAAATCLPKNPKATKDRQLSCTTNDASPLRPVSYYADRLRALVARKADPTRQGVWALVISGGNRYALGTSSDAFEAIFGIGPSCGGIGPEAMPSLRLREFERLTNAPYDLSRNTCDDWPLGRLGSVFHSGTADDGRLRPSCFGHCPLDLEPSTPTLEPMCEVTIHDTHGTSRPIPPCERSTTSEDPERDTWSLPPNATDSFCYFFRTDRGLEPTQAGRPRAPVTPTDTDDMSTPCFENGDLLEFGLWAGEGCSVVGDLQIVARCALSPDPARDCPDLMR